MLNLHDRDWQAFPLNSIFVIKPGKRLTKADMRKGNYPFVGATDSNNGITGFVSNTNVSLDNGVLGVNYNGSVVETFFHPYECIFSDDVKRLQLKNALYKNQYVYLFLKVAIVQQKEKYAYGYKFNGQRMNRQAIFLPVVNADVVKPEPDWQFMNDYIAEREQGCLARYENHLNDLTNKADVDIESLEQKVWHEFPLSSLFTITPTSSSIDKINLTKGNGDFPYISRTKRSNGVDSFVDEQQGYLHDKGNCITIGLDTQTVFFQPYDFYTGQNIQILRNEYLNVHTANFILPLLRNLLMAFSWGSQGATLTRLRRSKIMLPINEDNNPDWMYMEQYAHSIKNQKAKDYLQQKRTSKHGNPPY